MEKLKNILLSDEEIHFLINNLNLIKNEELDKVQKYGWNNEATAGAEEVIDRCSSILNNLINKL